MYGQKRFHDAFYTKKLHIISQTEKERIATSTTTGTLHTKETERSLVYIYIYIELLLHQQHFTNCFKKLIIH